MPEATVTHHVFPNGLTLVAESMPSVQSAAFSMIIPAGAAYEPDGLGGMASMLSEWITRGAGDLDNRQLLTALDNLGVSHGEGANTLHSSVSAATLGRNLIPALEIFAKVLRQPHLEDDEIEPIRALALQGLQGIEDDPSSKIMIELSQRHFPDPYGRSASGSIEGVERATPDDLRAFHQANYRPNGTILGVAGAIDWPSLKDAVGRLFGDWEPCPAPTLVERPGGSRRDHLLKETQQTQIALAYPTVAVDSPDFYQARAMTGILGGYASSRLFTEVREKRGLAYSVSAGYVGQKDRGAVFCTAGTSTDRAQETLDIILEEIARLEKHGVEAEELDMMRAGLKSSLIMQQESSYGRCTSLTSDWYYLGRVRSLAEISRSLDALTAASVGEFASKTNRNQMTVLTLGPTPLKLPV